MKGPMLMKPYNESIESLVAHYHTNLHQGLSAQEAQKRLQQNGPNSLPEPVQESWLIVFLTQFQSPLIYILVAAAAIIYFFGNDPLDAAIISGVLVFNAIIGTIQEGRTRTILDTLKKLIKSSSVVVRDGRRHVVDDAQLVVGDIIELKEGQRIPADARITLSQDLHLDESLLTGESRPCSKTADILQGDHVLGDQRNMVFRGTYITAGSGQAIVIATGQNTEIGKIHKTVEEIKTEMPLKKEVDRLAFIILIFILAICISLFAIGMFAGKPLAELLVMLTALFICVVPEGLPVVLTLVLVTGVYRLAKQHVLVKNLQAVEALGRSDVIIIDKTGTLTRNEMMVSDVFCDGALYHVTGNGYHAEGVITQDTMRIDAQAITPQSVICKLATACTLLSDAEIVFDKATGLFEIKGDPTEAALAVFAQKIGIACDITNTKYESVYEIPFAPSIKYHAHFFTANGKGLVFIAGAPEVVLAKSDMQQDQALQAALAKMLDDGLRVVAVGVKSCDVSGFSGVDQEAHYSFAQKQLESGVELLGVLGVQDAIRKDIDAIIDAARDAGMQIVMATGDHKKTAVYVAKKVGIYQTDDSVIDGAVFAQQTDQQASENLQKTTVYARVSPDDKLRIVRLFHEQGNIVAMTGDGINDAPSLVAADLGIAMGQIGAEVAKQAADIILLDDSFANIINAVKQGRHIFYTLKRVVLYFFATNMGEILIVLFALMLNALGADFPLPITAAQILWLNLVTDGFLDVALSMEPQEDDLLQKGWLEHKERLVDTNLLLKMFFIATPMGIAGLFVFFMYYQQDLALARTMTLITLAMFQWFNAWNCRSMRKSIFQLGMFTNRWLVLVTGFVLLLQLFVVYTPFMQYIFKTVPLSVEQWGLVFALSAPIVLIEEVRKYVVRIMWPA